MLNIKKLLYLPIIFFFLPAFAIIMPGNIVCLNFFIICWITIMTLIAIEPKNYIRRFYNLYNKTPLKYFFWFLILVFINSLILSLIGRTTIVQTIRTYLYVVVLQIIPIVLYISYVVGCRISYKNFIKVFISIFWISLLLGFSTFVADLFNIKILNDIFDILANLRILSWNLSGLDMVSATGHYSAFGLPRLKGLCQEPSDYAHWLCLFLPLICSIGSSKLKLYKNKVVNLLITKTIMPLTVISIIMTLSPIALVLMGGIIICFYFKSILKFIKNYFIPTLLFFLGLIFIFNSINLSETYLSRIINVVKHVKSFDDFIIVEASLATRIISYINMFCVFIKHPFMGVGVGNLPKFMYMQFQHSPVPLTPEILTKNNFIIALGQGKAIFNSCFSYRLLAENGFVIFSLFMYYYWQIYFRINKFLKLRTLTEYDYAILRGLSGCLVSCFVIALYNMNSPQLYIPMYFLLSFATVYIFILERRFNYENNIYR